MTLVWGFRSGELGWYLAENWDSDDAIYKYGPFETIEEAQELIDQMQIKLESS